MHTVVIPQKMSGTGTIHDLASQHFDRVIEFADDEKYAIVLAAYYGNSALYYTAKTAEEAVKISEREGEYSHAIIDRDGDMIDRDWLIRRAEVEAYSRAAAVLGKSGGLKTSERKAAASRENGKLGGRPHKAYQIDRVDDGGRVDAPYQIIEAISINDVINKLFGLDDLDVELADDAKNQITTKKINENGIVCWVVSWPQESDNTWRITVARR